MSVPESPEASSEPTPAGAPGAQPANPFVPRYREPWLNPAKRGAVAALALAGAVVLLAVGFLLGLGVGGGGHHGRGLERREAGIGCARFVDYGDCVGPRMGPGPRGWVRFRQPPVTATVTVTPATPVPTPSSSHR